MKEPKNHTIIYWAEIIQDLEAGTVENFKTGENKILYSRYSVYDNLPEVAKSEETQAEYDAWWRWYYALQADD